MTGGFPCQDISIAGKGEGIEGERSGLWSEMCRIIGEVRPKYAIIENVPMLIHRGLKRVLCDLAEIGYNAEWHCIPCSTVGGLHRRDRIWIIAYPIEDKETSLRGTVSESEVSHRTVSNSMCKGLEGSKQDAVHSGQSEEGNEVTSRSASESSGIRGEPKHIVTGEQIERFAQYAKTQWTTEPKLDRVAYGIPNRVHRLKGIGNAVVPQIPQFLGESILNFEKENI